MEKGEGGDCPGVGGGEVGLGDEAGGVEGVGGFAHVDVRGGAA